MIRNEEDCRELQKDIDSIDHWCKVWQMILNITKCKFMRIGRADTTEKYSMNTSSGKTDLVKVNEEKDLGILIDDDLKWTAHISQAAAKGNQLLGLIKRTFVHRDRHLMKVLITSVVRPHLEYGNTIWSPLYKKDIKALEKVQQRATRLVRGLEGMTYEDRLRTMEMPTLVYRRLRGDMIETYKYMHHLYSVDGTNLLPIHDSSSAMTTRGHSYKLKKRFCHIQLRAKFFSMRVVDIWNSLPEDIVSAPSVESFKGKLDRHWKNYRYQMNIDDIGRRREN